MSDWREAQRKTWDVLEGLCLMAGLGTLYDPPGRGGEGVQREGSLVIPA